MNIYQLKTAKDFQELFKDELTVEEIMHKYAEHVATKFAAECVNQALGNQFCVSNTLHHAIEEKYKSIIWVVTDGKKHW
jgi:hypothetical protein